jgi:hypothetical protein
VSWRWDWKAKQAIGNFSLENNYNEDLRTFFLLSLGVEKLRSLKFTQNYDCNLFNDYHGKITIAHFLPLKAEKNLLGNDVLLVHADHGAGVTIIISTLPLFYSTQALSFTHKLHFKSHHHHHYDFCFTSFKNRFFPIPSVSLNTHSQITGTELNQFFFLSLTHKTEWMSARSWMIVVVVMLHISSPPFMLKCLTIWSPFTLNWPNRYP